jgi:hypothetical protein
VLLSVGSDEAGQLLATAQRMHDRGYLEHAKTVQSTELSSAVGPSALDLGSLSQLNFARFQVDFRIAALVAFAAEKVRHGNVVIPENPACTLCPDAVTV